jgi:hypothetical protein
MTAAAVSGLFMKGTYECTFVLYPLTIFQLTLLHDDLDLSSEVE